MLGAWPTETIAGPIAANENNQPNAIATGPIVDAADMFTIKAEHKFTDTSSLSGLYIYNKTDEPGSTIMKPDAWYIASQDNFFGPLRRRPHVLVFNNTNIINDTTVLTLRYGWSHVAGLVRQAAVQRRDRIAGIQPELHQRAVAEGRLPRRSLRRRVEDVGGWGAIPDRWKSPYSINGTLSKLMGSHSLKVGADMRRLGVATVSDTQMGGRFDFDRLFTSNNGVGGHELASVLLGVPYSGSVPFDDGPFEWFTKYYGAYVQDDWRVQRTSDAELRPAVRARGRPAGDREPSDGRVRPERRPARSTRACRRPGCSRAARIKGGLIFAGVDGAPEEQGNPAAIKVAPRVGVTYAPSKNTVVRGGYGLFYAPWNYTATQARPDRLHADDVVDSVRQHHRRADRRRSTIRSPAA